MLDYMTAQEASNRWGLTLRIVQVLSTKGRIIVASKHWDMSTIPKDVEKFYLDIRKYKRHRLWKCKL